MDVELTTPARRRVELPRLLSRAEWSQLVPVERVNQLMTATFPLLAAWTGFQNPGISPWPFLGFGLAQSIALTGAGGFRPERWSPWCCWTLRPRWSPPSRSCSA